jgi:NAD(P)-dependent dehydrogenase (short-subunit alcohol dehydrogenase family)
VQIAHKIAAVTGGGSGIGAALCRAFAVGGARAVVVIDRDADAAESVARSCAGNAVALQCDVADAGAVDAVISDIVARFGGLDLMCSNAGIATGAGLDATPETWRRAIDVNVLGHVHVAQAAIAHLLGAEQGWLVVTASAAGLLTNPGDAPYTVTKHAAVGFAEWLAVTYGGRGLGVSVLCPLGVATPLLMDPLAAGAAAATVVAASGEILTPDAVAATVVSGLADESFLIVPHAEVARFWAQKARDPDRWLAGVRRLVDST